VCFVSAADWVTKELPSTLGAGRNFYANFVAKIPLLIRGTMAAPVDRFGETLADEHIRGGAFVNDSGRPLATSSTLSNAEMRLLGGAQWTRALEEFRAILGGLVCAPVNKEEIVNACGVDEMHDGINYTRTACIIAVAKAKECFEPFLHQLGYRLMHVMRRLLQMAMYLMRKDGQFLNGHELFLKRVGSCYYSFVEENMRSCLAKCLEDLESTTEFVTCVPAIRSLPHLFARLHGGDSNPLTTAMRTYIYAGGRCTPTGGRGCATCCPGYRRPLPSPPLRRRPTRRGRRCRPVAR